MNSWEQFMGHNICALHYLIFFWKSLRNNLWIVKYSTECRKYYGLTCYLTVGRSALRS